MKPNSAHPTGTSLDRLHPTQFRSTTASPGSHPSLYAAGAPCCASFDHKLLTSPVASGKPDRGVTTDRGEPDAVESEGQLRRDLLLRTDVPVQPPSRPRRDLRLLPGQPGLQHQGGSG